MHSGCEMSAEKIGSAVWPGGSVNVRLGKKHFKKLKPTPEATDCTAPAAESV